MNNLISRKDAIKALYDYWSGCSFDGDGYDIADRSEDVLNDLPSAETERKKGKWRRRLVDCGFNADWHCSECGWKTSLEEHGYNFCPNCGADMRGEKDE